MTRWPYPRIVAHRGGGKLAPENTLGAIRLGAELGFGGVEFDVMLSSDGVPVLIHDQTLERTTSLFVTHDQVEAMTLAQRMIVMNGGRAEQIGAPLEVYARPASTFVAGFIGSPAMNLIPETRGGRRLLFGIRPEHLEPCGEAEAKFVIDVDLIEPLGADTLVYGHLAGNGEGVRVAARLHASLDARTGRLPLRYDPAQGHWFDADSGQRIDPEPAAA